MVSRLNWVGKSVRHTDGRHGKVSREYVGFMHIVLTFRLTDGSEVLIELNTDGTNSGAAGWSWDAACSLRGETEPIWYAMDN